MREVPAYTVIRPYGYYEKGAIIYPTGAMREGLLAMGLIAKCETAPKQDPFDIAPKRGPGRPRKAAV